MRRASLMLALIALTAGACGSDDKQIGGVVREYMVGIGRGDGERACNALAGPYRDEFLVDQHEGGCEARVEQYQDGLDEEERRAYEETKIAKLQLIGKEKAIVRTRSPAPNEEFVGDAAFNMSKFGDGWKIESNNEFEALD